jgi:23S rRNA (pseudouridine1915-N3)-methyltransferase
MGVGAAFQDGARGVGLIVEIVLCTVGKPRLAYAAAGSAEYLGRLRRYGPVEWRVAKSGSREMESRRLLELSAGCIRVALDRSGDLFSSEQVAELIGSHEMRATRRLAFLIGGAEGFGAAFLAGCDRRWSLGPQTLPHELALVVVLEQIYRARTIQRGEPYHRA